jgi:hypothetical protein
MRSIVSLSIHNNIFMEFGIVMERLADKTCGMV